MTKKPKQKASASADKIVGDSGAIDYYKLLPAWSFRICDFSHPQWGLTRNLNLVEPLLKRLKDFEGQRWVDIFSDTSGRKNKTKNHEVVTSRLPREAQKRLSTLNLEDYDVICSLSITGRRRLWGFLSEGVFLILWLDPDHSILPAEKIHT